MKVVIFLGLLAVATCVTDDGCEEEEENCANDMIKAFKGSQDEEKEVSCGKLKKYLDCIEAFADRCISESKRKDVKKSIDRMVEIMNEFCSEPNDDENAVYHIELPEEGVTADGCKEEGRNCLNGYTEAINGIEGEEKEVYCGKLKKSLDCIIAFADRCMNERIRKVAQKEIDGMVEIINKLCSEQNEDENVLDDIELPEEGVTADGCKEEGQNCVNDMEEAFNGIRGEEKEFYCGKLKKSLDCIAAFADRCISESIRKDVQKKFDRMVEETNKFCSEQNNDENSLDDIELPKEGVTSDGCEEEGQNCLNDVMESYKGSQDEEKEVYCGKLKKYPDCIAAFADRCISESKRKDVQKNIDRVVKIINKFCSEPNDDENALDDIELPEEGVTSDECEEEGQNCVNDMIESYKGSQDEEKGVYCGNVKKSVDCLAAFAGRCMSESKWKDARKEIDRMIENANKLCSEPYDDENVLDDIELPEEEQKNVDCVNEGKILSYVGECIDQINQKIKSRHWGITGSLRDNTCEISLFLAQCTSKKVGKDCGEEIEEPFFNTMLRGLKKQGPYAAKSPKCVEAFQEAEEYFSNLHEDKERFVRYVSFAKLIP